MADNTNRLAGVASLSLDGVNVLVKGSLYYKVSGATREELNGQDGPHGYKEMPIQGEMGGTLRDAGGLSVAALAAMTDSTIVFQLANGKTVIGRSMYTTEPPRVNTEEAEVEIAWKGLSVQDFSNV